MAKRISVLMGIYNCADTLPEAIECILAQTVTDWELILCDDGSKDSTYAIAAEYQEKYPDQIILIKNEKNMGLNYTLNHCLSHAKGEFIARMDGDDLCDPARFEKQLAALEQMPDIAILGTRINLFDDKGVWGKTKPISFPQKKDFIYGTPFSHGSCMVRREAYLAVDGYSVDEKLIRVEDYHLWAKMYAKGYRGANLDEALYSLRDDRDAAGRRRFKARVNEAYVLRLAVKMLDLPWWKRIYSVRPIILGLLPTKLYQYLHRAKRKADIP